MTLWNNDTEMQFFTEALKNFASPEQLFYNLQGGYFAYVPKGSDAEGQTLQSRNSLIGQFTEKWSKTIFEPIAKELGLHAVNSVVCDELGLSRQSSAVQQVLQIYSTDWSLFGSFVKDFVRNHLYQKFSAYVPSSTRQGADALHKILMRNRELYKYEYSDLGALESLLSEYVSGDIDFPEVLKKSTTPDITISTIPFA